MCCASLLQQAVLGLRHLSRAANKTLVNQISAADMKQCTSFGCAGLFEWSMKYQDGTLPASEAKELTPEKKKWCADASAAITKTCAIQTAVSLPDPQKPWLWK